MSIADNLKQVLDSLPAEVELVAVSKYHTNEEILEAYEAGARAFGESRAQDLKVKHETLPKDIEWHFIGALQTNKIKYIISYVHLIHSVDSLRLLEEINKHAARVNRRVDCLLEIHIAREASKSGFTFDDCRSLLQAGSHRELEHVRICGLMGMATFTDDERQIATEFESLKNFFDEVKAAHFTNDEAFSQLSMGMSDDYHIAVSQGSTMVRVGSRIFG